MAEQQRRNVDMEEEQRKWRSRWYASASAKADRLAHWQTVDQLYQAQHWQRNRASWRPDPVLNYTFHVTEEHRAQLGQLKPDPVFRPRRPTDDKKTDVFREVMRYGWQARRVPKHMDLGNVGFLLKGTVLYHVYWDPSIVGGAPEPVELTSPVTGPNGQALVGPTGQPLMKPVLQAAGTLFKGDWNIRLVDPAHFFVDPGLGSWDIQEAAWCGVGELKLLSAMQARYGKALGDLSPADPDVLQQGYVRPATTYTQAPTDDKYVYVFEAYEKVPADQQHMAAGYRYNLRKAVFVNWRLVDVQDYWTKPGKYPFAPQHNYSIPGQFWALGDPQQFIALERLVRKLYELIALNSMLTSSKQKILHPRAGLNPNSFTMEPGKVYVPTMSAVDIDVSKILWPIPTDGMPQYVFQFLEMVKTDIQTITGMFQGLPPGVHAASAVIAVFERLAGRMKRKAEAAAEAARGIVELVSDLIVENYTEERVFRLTQPIDGVPWAVFRGSDYDGMEMDIEVDIASSAPLSKAILAEQAGSAYKNGAIKASEYLKAIDFPYPDILEAVRQREQQAEEQARMQAQMAAQGPPGQPGAPEQPAPGSGPELPPGVNLEGATPGAKTLIMNNLAGAGRV